MAPAGGTTALLRAVVGGLRGPGRPLWARDAPQLCSTQAATKAPPTPPSPYQEKPWAYLESEEYRATYGDKPVWHGYRRNHKGAIPPQRTRKTCLRKGKLVGNPCPICRDHNLHVDFRNVKLLDQFICPHSGIIFHPTYTGVCMRQHKLLSKAITQAQEHGLLWLQVPYVPVPQEDFSNRHPAVGKTPPAPMLAPGHPWYPWYEWQPPPAADIARMRRLYKDYLKEKEPPPAVGTPMDTPPAPCVEPRGE
ncbi:28S ribosomal protein S18b, mitochondrial isoform X1 [Falco naumanni]|uniref:28S ribosomal protein S18b, mitochondrial isoform X1 n=1 Tax=Falco naumanni TaxID=148594 RepID=UPI001ADE806B|nr:28S ribosomal protein S18b, mitochondrial isoform X1 [Falco naumanni]